MLTQNGTKSDLKVFFRSAVVEVIRDRCQCNFWAAFISEGVLLCDQEASMEVVFRANISSFGRYPSSQLVRFIEDWVQDGPNRTNGIHLVTFDPYCPVRVNNTDPLCSRHPTFSLTHIALVTLAGAILLASLVAAILVVIVLLYRRKYRRPLISKLAREQSERRR